MNPRKIMIGKDVIKQVHVATLLGIKMTDDQKWNEQILGVGGIISCLNHKFFLLKRLGNKLRMAQICKAADSIFISKSRYGVQLYGKVRFKKSDPENGLIDDVQLVQNKLIRWLNGVTLKDRKRTSDLLKIIKMLYVNQINAQVKMSAMWKAHNWDNYQLKVEKSI